MTNVSNIYKVISNKRGLAFQGLSRPTLKDFFGMRYGHRFINKHKHTGPVLLLDGDSGLNTDITEKHTISYSSSAPYLGAASQDSTDPKCGNYSIYFPAASVCNITRSGTLLELGSSDFTIDLWFKGRIYLQGNTTLFSSCIDTGYMFYIQSGNDFSGEAFMYLYFSVYESGTTLYKGRIDVKEYLSNQSVWHHVGVCRAGNTLYAAINGSVTPFDKLIGDLEIPASKCDSSIGQFRLGMLIDQFRVQKGTALFTSNYQLTDTGLDYSAGTLN